MTTASFDAKVVLVSEAEETDPSDLVQVDDELSFQLSLDGETRMLSNGDLGDEASSKGFIYVPDLGPDHRCPNATSSLIPQNVTRRDGFPRSDYDLIALAPWVSPNCTLSYLETARNDSATAFIFYRPGSRDTLPRPVSDQMWRLDNAKTWKSDFRFPVYAVSGKVGGNLMNQSAEYSGKLTDVDHGSELAGRYDDSELPRLSISLTSDDHSRTLPNLWIFLIGVLAVLLTFVISSSFAMRFIQRRRRQALARRLAAGEVDLEAIGIRKLRVPRSMLDKMPLYIYTESSTTPAAEKPSETTPQCNGSELRPSSEGHRAQYGTVNTSPTGLGTHSPATPSSEREPSPTHNQRASLPENSLMYSQSTCPICLSDYVPLETNVRELPCGHIFHPECIDTFLLQTSSLCPVCKKCTLPPGYCPEEVTNAMVYRERLARARQREARSRPLPTPIPTRSEVYRNRNGYVRPIRSPASRTAAEDSIPSNGSQTIFSRLRGWALSPFETETQQGDDNATSSNNPANSNTEEGHDHDTPHEERMRRRAVAMLGRHHTAEDHDRDEESTSRWRRALNKYFPGFR